MLRALVWGHGAEAEETFLCLVLPGLSLQLKWGVILCGGTEITSADSPRFLWCWNLPDSSWEEQGQSPFQRGGKGRGLCFGETHCSFFVVLKGVFGAFVVF